MQRIIVFAKRNMKEMLVNPLSYIFVLGFPVLMLILFAVINCVIRGSFALQAENLPIDQVAALESQIPVTFRMRNNAPSMAFFGLTFVMLMMTLLVSQDRSSAFLTRLFSSPLRAHEYIIGYMIPGLILCLAQMFICYAAGDVIGVIEGENIGGEPNSYNFGIAILSLLSQIPSAFLFVSLGLLCGTVLGEKSAPPLTSVLINVAGIFGGCYFPLEMLEGLAVFCKCMPFYPQVLLSRAIMNSEPLDFMNFGMYLMIVLAYAAVVSVFAVFAFSSKMMDGKK